VTPVVEDHKDIAVGTLVKIKKDPKNHRPLKVVIKTADGPETFRVRTTEGRLPTRSEEEFWDEFFERWPELLSTIEFDEGFFETAGVREGQEVAVSHYKVRNRAGVGERGTDHYRVRPASKPLPLIYDNEALPRYLFFGAALMTLGILVLLVRKLPDFFLRSAFWLRCLGRYRIKVVGMSNLPTNGRAILATNCSDMDSSLQVLAATDRYTRFILLEQLPVKEPTPLIRYLAARAGFTIIPLDGLGGDWSKALNHAAQALQRHDLLGVSVNGIAPPGASQELDSHLRELPWNEAPVVPVFCAPEPGRKPPHRGRRIRVVFGQPMPGHAGLEEVRRAIHGLGEWLEKAETADEIPKTIMIPGPSRTPSHP
jgi:hypothetical protein